jgi:hypothetical protein
VLARLGVADGLDEVRVARPLHDVAADGVEEPGARAEHEVDGRPRDARHARDAVDAHRLRRRVAEPLVHRVEDAPPRVVGGLRPQSLLVLPGGHELRQPI